MNTITETNAITASWASASEWASVRTCDLGVLTMPVDGCGLAARATTVEAAKPRYGAAAGFSVEAHQGAVIAEPTPGTPVWSPPT